MPSSSVDDQGRRSCQRALAMDRDQGAPSRSAGGACVRWRSQPRPRHEHPLDFPSNAGPRLPSLETASQELIVAGFGVACVRGDRHLHSVRIEPLGRRRSADATAELPTRVLGDRPGAAGRTAWESWRIRFANSATNVRSSSTRRAASRSRRRARTSASARLSCSAFASASS